MPRLSGIALARKYAGEKLVRMVGEKRAAAVRAELPTEDQSPMVRPDAELLWALTEVYSRKLGAK
jgi:hypothetical protein